MTDDPKELERRLTQATARHDLAEDSLDPETTALRAGWLAFEELLEAAQPQANRPLPRPLVLPARSKKDWFAVTIAVLAVSLLIAATVTWSMRGVKPGTVPTVKPFELAHNGAKPSDTNDGLKTQLPHATAQPTPTISGNAASWDDSLDQEISAAAQAVAAVQQDWNAQAGSLLAIEYQLQQLRQDMESGTL
jgi:hypothetical protein